MKLQISGLCASRAHLALTRAGYTVLKTRHYYERPQNLHNPSAFANSNLKTSKLSRNGLTSNKQRNMPRRRRELWRNLVLVVHRTAQLHVHFVFAQPSIYDESARTITKDVNLRDSEVCYNISIWWKGIWRLILLLVFVIDFTQGFTPDFALYVFLRRYLHMKPVKTFVKTESRKRSWYIPRYNGPWSLLDESEVSETYLRRYWKVSRLSGQGQRKEIWYRIRIHDAVLKESLLLVTVEGSLVAIRRSSKPSKSALYPLAENFSSHANRDGRG